MSEGIAIRPVGTPAAHCATSAAQDLPACLAPRWPRLPRRPRLHWVPAAVAAVLQVAAEAVAEAEAGEPPDACFERDFRRNASRDLAGRASMRCTVSLAVILCALLPGC